MDVVYCAHFGGHICVYADRYDYCPEECEIVKKSKQL